MTTDPAGAELTGAEPAKPNPAATDPAATDPTGPDLADRERRESEPVEPGYLLIDLPPMPAFDDRAIRWAIARGIAAAGFLAMVFLVVLLMVVFLVSGVLQEAHGGRFGAIAFQSIAAAHPEYQIAQEGSCCAVGPLGGIPNLGLESELRIRVRPTGALDYSGDHIVAVDQDIFGEVTADFGTATTPLDRIGYGRPDKADTIAFIHQLPVPMTVSAVVEFSQPLDEFGLDRFYNDDVPIGAVSDRSATMYLTDPYDVAQRHRVCWPAIDFDSLRRWAYGLRSSDDGFLKVIGLPPAAEIKRAAEQPLVYAIVMPRLPLSLAATLVANPAVRSVNILDVTFDPYVQNTH